MAVCCAPHFRDIPIQVSLRHPDIVPIYTKMIACAQGTIDVQAYMLDDFYSAAWESFLMVVGRRLRVIVDYSSVRNGRPVQGPPALKKLQDRGALIRVHRPIKHVFSAQHSKAMCCDGAVLVVGSHNFSWNSAHRMHENVLLTQIESSITEWKYQFQALWDLEWDGRTDTGTRDLTAEDIREGLTNAKSPDGDGDSSSTTAAPRSTASTRGRAARSSDSSHT